MADDRPAVALAAVPGRRQRTLALAREIERCGCAGIDCASLGDATGSRKVLVFATKYIPFGTSRPNAR